MSQPGEPTLPTRDQVTSWDIEGLQTVAANAAAIADSIKAASDTVHTTIHDDLHWSGDAKNAADDRADREQREMRAVATAYYDLEDVYKKVYQAIEYPVAQIKSLVRLYEVEPVVIGNDAAWTVHNMADEDDAAEISRTLVGYATTIANADAQWKPKIEAAIDEIRKMVPLANSQDAAIAGGGLSPERAAAVAYANQWALGRNPEYDNHGDADCTNFVSQCLRAGGFKDEGDGGVPYMHHDESGRWYYNHHDDMPDDNSYSWSGAPNLHDYLLRNNPAPGTPSGTEVQTGTIDSTTSQADPLALSHAGLKPGDIVQYELSSGEHSGQINHTVIYVGQKPVTLPNGQTVMADVVDYHSHENKQVAWSLQQGDWTSFPVKYHMIKVNYPGD
ncbi:amidase domain-containing protein [Nocardia elegans]|uniref:amidase domain-containing protein n=1 Tax=Nocardia elegans TaxID=300029 RepID=UPI001895F89D|nr:amidase domain-containing protein [Nocardia elegans]MBF6245200.1 amidase domain-containing protein [Nocardia elegans]